MIISKSPNTSPISVKLMQRPFHAFAEVYKVTEAV